MQMQYWNYDDTVWNYAKQIVVMIQCEILTRRVASLLAPGCSLVSPDHDDDHYKRCKNCECCPVSLFIVRVTMIVRHSGSQLSEMSTTSHKFTNHTMSLSWSKRSKVSRIALWRCSLFSLFVLSFCQNTIPDWCRVYIVGAMWDVWMDGLGLDLWVGWGKEHLAVLISHLQLRCCTWLDWIGLDGNLWVGWGTEHLGNTVLIFFSKNDHHYPNHGHNW